jgi:Cu-processing system permease protein
MFGTLYLYNAREFIELLLAQPVGRPAMFAGLYVGLTARWSADSDSASAYRSCQFGHGFHPSPGAHHLLATGILLTLISPRRVPAGPPLRGSGPGLGAALAVWLAFAVLYDWVGAAGRPRVRRLIPSSRHFSA